VDKALKMIVHRVSESLPPLNDALLSDFRRDRIADMVGYLDRHFRATELFHGELKYVGMHVMAPHERLAAMADRNSSYRGKVTIQASTTIAIRFDFEFQGQEFHSTVEVPYMRDGAIVLNGTNYYPLFVIIERVIDRVDDTTVTIKVARAQLRFLRLLEQPIELTSGVVYREKVPTAKIHLGRGSRKRDKKPHLVPIVLYHLCEYGLEGTLRRYGFPDHAVTFWTKLQDDPEFAAARLQSGMYLAVRKDQLASLTKRRVVASLICMLNKGPKYRPELLYSAKCEWFKQALGEYITSLDSETQIYQQAMDHLASNRTMIDPAAKSSLAAVGLESEDLNELLFHAFYKLDEWLAVSNPNDLFARQLGSISLLLAEYLRKVMSKQFNCMRRGTVTSLVISGFMRQISTSAKYVKGWALRTVGDASSDNWLLTIGGKRVRTFKPMERAGSKESAMQGVPSVLTVPHYSELIVYSIFAMSAKTPLVSGSINPFVQIDEDGNFLEPPWAAAEIGSAFNC